MVAIVSFPDESTKKVGCTKYVFSPRPLFDLRCRCPVEAMLPSFRRLTDRLVDRRIGNGVAIMCSFSSE